MAKLCGMNVVVPEPITREEYYWRIYSDFREYTGALPIVIASRSGGTLRNYRIYGNSVQDGVPTPEEPIEVQSVGDKTVNLFDAGSAELGKEIVGDTIVPSSYWFVSDYIPVHTGTLYAVNMGIGNLGTAILAYTSKKSEPKRLSFNDGTVEIDSNYQFVQINGMITAINSVMVTLNQPIENYEPYGYKIPIAVYGTNNNLFNDTDLSYGAWYDGTGAYLTDTTYSVMSDYLPVSSAQYYVQILGTPPFSFELVWFDNNKDFISRYYRTSLSSQEYICKAADGSAFFRIGLACRTSQTITEDYVLDSNLYVSTVPIDKTTTNIYLNEPLRKIGDYADYVDFEDQCVVRKISTLDLGSIKWEKTTSLNFLSQRSITNMRIISNNAVGNALCNAYPEVRATDFTNRDAGFSSCLNTAPRPYFRDTDKTALTAEEFQASMTGIELYYTLVEPILEPLDLSQIPTFEGENVLTVDTTIQPSQMYVKYL